MPEDSVGLSRGAKIKLTREEEAEIWKEVAELRKEKDCRNSPRYLQLRERMISSCFRRAFWLAKIQSSHAPWMDTWDLFQEGTVLLIGAFERYVFDGRARFLTYAGECVRLGLKNVVWAKEERTKAGCKHTRKKLRQSEELARKQRKDGLPPDWKVIARIVGLKLETLLSFLISSKAERISLNDPVKEGSNLTWSERIADQRMNPEEEFLTRDLIPIIQKVLPLLTPRQAFVIGYRFGLEGEVKTLEDIAEMIGSTRQNVSLIETKAKKKLARILRNGGFFKGGEKELRLHLQ